MVDFSKKLGKKLVEAVTDPVALYDTLDRAVDKGPLRPAQLAVLKEWSEQRRQDRDVIIKLHTGQGKTLIGLLLLQARLNETSSPAIYLCPDNYLIRQTVEQAKQFGIATCVAESELPQSFLDGREILVTSVQKLFNGLTRFGLDNASVMLGTLLMDDAHACSDRIRQSSTITLKHDHGAYSELLALFRDHLRGQGAGSLADIDNGKHGAVLPVPYWAWLEHDDDVARILSNHAESSAIRFAWPLVKDSLGSCRCIFSGTSLEIEPFLAPLDRFGSYQHAELRVYMSATVTDDAFLVKGLRLAPETIAAPVTYAKERWSGEKMVLMPSLIDDTLGRSEIVRAYGKEHSQFNYGVVALAPSFKRTRDWDKYGALVAKNDTLASAVAGLRDGDFKKTVVLVNRYDGVDLPDSMCRLLILDSKPYSERLVDLYEEQCRASSEATLMRTVRAVEQGLGRSVRGEKDYSVILIAGADVVRLLRDSRSKKYFSVQLNTQIELGIEAAEMARDDVRNGEQPLTALLGLLHQCLDRDSSWKAFYAERMNSVVAGIANERILKLYERELQAELKHLAGDYQGAADDLQAALDEGVVESGDQSWYLQEMARYLYAGKRGKSHSLQTTAFSRNRRLLRPSEGVTVAQLELVSHGRMERIADWASRFESYEQLSIAVADIVTNLAFGVSADKFERALNELAPALGFKGEMPDKEWKEGPDNLWAIGDNQYLLWEVKSEVKTTRSEISKYEANQMNTSCTWFLRHYKGCDHSPLMIIPTHKLGNAAAFAHPVAVLAEVELSKFTKAVRGFFKSLESMNLKDLASDELQTLVLSHKLDRQSLCGNLGREPRQTRG